MIAGQGETESVAQDLSGVRHGEFLMMTPGERFDPEG
jgi:hypothetical protein